MFWKKHYYQFSSLSIENSRLLILFYFEYESSLNSFPNKLHIQAWVYFFVEQAEVCLQATLINYFFPLYDKTMTKFFNPFTNLC